MVSGIHKSHSFRKVFVKTPGGRTVVHRRLPNTGAATCPITGNKLAGMPRGRPKKLRSLAKSKRVPSRAFGGNLSAPAARRELINRARKL